MPERSGSTHVPPGIVFFQLEIWCRCEGVPWFKWYLTHSKNLLW